MPPYLLAYASALLCVMCFVTCAFFFQRFRWHLRKRLGKKRLGFYPTSASLGNALQTLQIFAEPRVEHVLEEKLDEDVDDDEAGGSDDPAEHLQRQAARIRKGKQLGHLTARIPK